MSTRRELPTDVAAAFDRVPEARDRFAALPAERQLEWLNWIDRGRGEGGRASRIDEMIRRLLPSAAATEEEEVVEPAAPPRERYWWLWLLLLLLLVLGGLLLWWLLSRDDNKATVPNVVGLKSQVAAQRIHDENLKVTPVTGQSKRPPDVVFAQAPGAGTQLDEEQTVTISISSGRQAVPDVTGLQEQEAAQRLDDAGFQSEVHRGASTRPQGVVISQTPVAGVTADAGTIVKLAVSSGERPVLVPQVVGQTQGSAVNAVTAKGLQPVLQNVPSAQPAGTVVAQKPKAGTEVDKGAKVTLNISTGTGPATTTTTTTATTASSSVKVPKVTGLSEAQALRDLNGAGLPATVVFQNSSQSAGQVLAQSPAASASAQRGSHVRITVSNGPNPQPAETVPNVVGQDQATATNHLQSAGFRVVVLNRPASNASQNGVVIEQQPHAGASIPGNSLVALYVGRSG
ncbi:MAG: PASTA domain-containing protein [Gaiellaceae bacterium]